MHHYLSFLNRLASAARVGLAYALLPLRVLGVVAVIVLGLSLQLACFGWVQPRTARRIITWWSRTVLACVGLKVSTNSVASASNLASNLAANLASNLTSDLAPAATQLRCALFVSNHISWLDILVLQATAPVVFVAKSEIKAWPVLGWMVTLAGTCYIDRSRRAALRSVHSAITAQLQAGQSVCIFPEGTTSDGSQVLPFHGGLLQAAIDAGVPVQPVRLDYSHLAAAYIGDTTLLGSLGSILLTPRLQVRVQVLPAIETAQVTRQAIALSAFESVSSRGAAPSDGLLLR